MNLIVSPLFPAVLEYTSSDETVKSNKIFDDPYASLEPPPSECHARTQRRSQIVPPAPTQATAGLLLEHRSVVRFPFRNLLESAIRSVSVPAPNPEGAALLN